MKNPLAKYTIAVTGDFGDKRSHDDLKRWMESAGGKWITSVTKETTHLVCTHDHWKKKTTSVKAALAHRNVKIVSYDWLEDSLMQRTHKNEGPYLLKKILKLDKKAKLQNKAREMKTIKKEVKRFEKGCKAARTDLGSGTSRTKPSMSLLKPAFLDHVDSLSSPSATSKLARLRADRTTKSYKLEAAESKGTNNDLSGQIDNYHIYRDSTGFDYDVTLARVDLANNRNERYQLRLYESHFKPHSYSTHIRFIRPSAAPIDQIQAPLGSTFQVAFREFCKVFCGKTRIHWDERFSYQNSCCGEMDSMGERKDERGILAYTYVPPEEDQPRGLVPAVELLREKHEEDDLGF